MFAFDMDPANASALSVFLELMFSNAKKLLKNNMPQELERIRKEVLKNLIKENPDKKLEELEQMSWAIANSIYENRKKKSNWKKTFLKPVQPGYNGEKFREEIIFERGYKCEKCGKETKRFNCRPQKDQYFY